MPALFGRDCLHEIKPNWNLICAISKEKPPQRSYEVLQDEISTLKSTKAKLALEEGSKPKFCKAGRSPMSWNRKLRSSWNAWKKKEYYPRSNSATCRHLLYLSSNQMWQYASGVKYITVNPQLQTEKNTIPTSHRWHIFWAGGGGRKKFTKIDFRQT